MPGERRRLQVRGVGLASMSLALVLLASVLLASVLLAGCSALQTTVTVQTTATGSSTPSTPGTAQPTAPAATATATTPIILCPGCVHLPPSIHQVLKQQTLAGTDVGPVTATCPSGEIALSGGWATNPAGGSGVQVYRSSRDSTAGWDIYVSHTSATLVNAYVECLANASGATIAERADFGTTVNTYGGSGDGYAGPTCNAGEKLVGGGFGIGAGTGFNQVLSLVAVGPSNLGSSTFWEVEVYGAAGYRAYGYAECLTYSGAHVSFIHSADQANLASATAVCPAGSTPSGGGFGLPSDSAGTLVVTMDATNSGWQVYSQSAQTSAYAACVTFS